MSLFDDQLPDMREPRPPFKGRNSLTDHKKKTSDVPLNDSVRFKNHLPGTGTVN